MSIFKKKHSNNITEENNVIACKKCGISMSTIQQEKEALENMIKAAGGGLFFDTFSNALARCKNCGKTSCLKCALERRGRFNKCCPFCKKEYDTDSIIPA